MSVIDDETPNRPILVNYFFEDNEDDDDDNDNNNQDDHEEDREKGKGKQGKPKNEDELEDEEDESEDIEANEEKPTMSKAALENILSHQAVIPDKIVHEMLTHLELPKECMSEDINLLAIGNTTRKPPLFWHGEYMEPKNLVEMLFGGIHYHGKKWSAAQPEPFTIKKAGGNITGPHKWSGRKKKWVSLLDEIEEIFKEKLGMELLQFPEGKSRWDRKKVVVFCCKLCGYQKSKKELKKKEKKECKAENLGEKRKEEVKDDEEKHPSNYPIIRVKLNSDERMDPAGKTRYFFWLELLEAYFHKCVGKKETQELVKKVEIIPGYLKIDWSNKGNEMMEQLRKEAFGEWVDHLHTFENPDETMPPGEKVVFPSEDEVEDNRTQVLLEKGLPVGVKEKCMTQYLAWVIYKIVWELGIAPEFTKHLPVSYESVKGKAIPCGLWPTMKNDGKDPVHLYVSGVVLMFGGMALGADGKIAKDVEGKQLLHQAAHRDFVSEYFGCVVDCPLLNGLTKPFTVNIALEDERCIYIEQPKNTVQVNLNNMLLVGGETVHGGIAYVCDTSEKPLKYHPSLHFVFESKRFKRSTNMVGLPKMQVGYTPPAHIRKLSKIELEGRLKEVAEQFVNLASESLVRDETMYVAVKKKVMTHLAQVEKEEKKKKKVATPKKKRKESPKGKTSVVPARKRGRKSGQDEMIGEKGTGGEEE